MAINNPLAFRWSDVSESFGQLNCSFHRESPFQSQSILRYNTCLLLSLPVVFKAKLLLIVKYSDGLMFVKKGPKNTGE